MLAQGARCSIRKPHLWREWNCLNRLNRCASWTELARVGAAAAHGQKVVCAHLFYLYFLADTESRCAPRPGIDTVARRQVVACFSVVEVDIDVPFRKRLGVNVHREHVGIIRVRLLTTSDSFQSLSTRAMSPGPVIKIAADIGPCSPRISCQACMHILSRRWMSTL